MRQKVKSAKKFSGRIRVGGDKSISHRALMLAAITDGRSTIENLNPGADIDSTISCLCDLGVDMERKGAVAVVHGKGLRGLKKPDCVLDVGNSGTTIRLLSGILAGQHFSSTMTGDKSIQQRPMSRIAQPLRRMGSTVQGNDGDLAPLTIDGGDLRPIDFETPVASAQVKSCLLFAGLYADGVTKITEPVASRDHTERMLPVFGVEVIKKSFAVSVMGPARLRPVHYRIPGDLSSAAFFIAAATMIDESSLIIENVGVNSTRRGVLDLLIESGANITLASMGEANNEPYADLYVKSSEIKAFNIGGDLVPKVIDEIPALAILATQASGTTIIEDAGELRHKESDRLRAITENLKMMGAQVEEREEGLIIEGPTPLHGAVLRSFGDHRIAMSFAMAALVADGASVIDGAECVDISHPGFFADIARLAYV